MDFEAVDQQASVQNVGAPCLRTSKVDCPARSLSRLLLCSILVDHDEETSALYNDDTDTFFSEYSDMRRGGNEQPRHPHTTTQVTATSNTTTKQADWDEWQDF